MAKYIFHVDKFKSNIHNLKKTFGALNRDIIIGISYKTNYTPYLIEIAESLGCIAEVVSDMEQKLALKINPERTRYLYNGPIKSEESLLLASETNGVIQVDNIEEYSLLTRLADRENKKFQIALRVNGSDTKYGASRFGLTKTDFDNILLSVEKDHNVEIIGLHIHLPFRDIDSFQTRGQIMLKYIKDAAGTLPNLTYLNYGGGMMGKIHHQIASAFPKGIHGMPDYARVIVEAHRRVEKVLHKNLDIVLEPGSSLIADTWDYVVVVKAVKLIANRHYYFVDGSAHNFKTTSSKFNPAVEFDDSLRSNSNTLESYVVGNTCIESDILFEGKLPKLKVGDELTIKNVGSYSVVMKPPFIHPNVSVVAIEKNKKDKIIKRNETMADIFKTFIFS